MSEESKKTMAIGLDVGTSRIVVAERNGEGYKFQSQLNAFVTVPFSKMARRALKKERVPHVVQRSEIVVYGNESERLADLFHLEARRPMSRGVLNSGEPNGLMLIRQIIEAVTGGDRAGMSVVHSVPAAPLDGEDNITYHEAAVGQLLKEMGYQVQSIDEGLAVIYSELEKTNYTGIGISCGGGLCNVCLAYLSAPLFSFSIPKAGDFIDASVASVTNELATRVRITKETAFHFNGNFSDKVQQALSIYYLQVIQAIVEGLREAFSDSTNVPRIGRPVPIVLSGGSAMAAGFRDRFEESLREVELPISISEITLASDPLNTTAKGALVAALCEL